MYNQHIVIATLLLIVFVVIIVWYRVVSKPKKKIVTEDSTLEEAVQIAKDHGRAPGGNFLFRVESKFLSDDHKAALRKKGWDVGHVYAFAPEDFDPNQ